MTSADRFSVFLPTQRARRAQWRWAAAAVVLSAVLTAAIAPFAARPLPRSELFLPIYQSAIVVVELTTAALLFGQFMILRTVPLLFLVAAYLFGATMAVLHLLSFPGLFSATGLFGSDAQTTAWLYFGWRGGQALAIAAYAFANRREAPPLAPGRERRAGAWALAAAPGLALALLALATLGHDMLPEIMSGSADLGLKRAVALVTLALVALPLPALLWRRPLSVLDLWLVVVVCVCLCQTALEAVLNSGRFSFGWYAGRVLGLPAAAALLVALVSQDSQVHRRLIAARAAEAELRRLSEARLAGREGEYQRIAHELHEDVAQSLALLKLELHGLGTHAADGEAAARLARADRAVDDALASVRRVVAELRPPMLDHLGFAYSLEALVDHVMERRELVCDLAIEPPAAELDEPFSTAVFRIVEGLLGAAQVTPGSGADASVVVRVGARRVELRVLLHGLPGRNAAVPDGVRERVLTLGGRLHAAAVAGAGAATEVAVAFPLDHTAAARAVLP